MANIAENAILGTKTETKNENPVETKKDTAEENKTNKLLSAEEISRKVNQGKAEDAPVIEGIREELKTEQKEGNGVSRREQEANMKELNHRIYIFLKKKFAEEEANKKWFQVLGTNKSEALLSVSDKQENVFAMLRHLKAKKGIEVNLSDYPEIAEMGATLLGGADKFQDFVAKGTGKMEKFEDKHIKKGLPGMAGHSAGSFK